MWTGEGFAGAITLIYVFAGFILIGPALLFGHVLLLSARLWSYRAYLVFGMLVGPGLLQEFTRKPAILVGVILGGVSALALRFLIQTQITDKNNTSILQGRLSKHPFLACAASIIFVRISYILMNYRIWEDLWQGDLDAWGYTHTFYFWTVSLVVFALVIGLTRWMQMRYDFARVQWRYLIAAMLSVSILFLANNIYYSIRLSQIYLYWSFVHMCSTAASGWIMFATYENLTGIREVSVQTDDAGNELPAL